MEEKGESKVCFVTIGATAAFDTLIDKTTDHQFLQALGELGYTALRLQYGKTGSSLIDRATDRLESSEERECFLPISGFDFKKDGLRDDMLAARDGVVISHAGSGTILEALRMAIPLIVVPNPTLLDNHQAELAEEMARQRNLVEALREAEKLRRKMNEWPPKSSRGDGRGLIGVMDDELGFVD